MGFNPAEHKMEPNSGLVPPTNPGVAIPYPKWVKPHDSHVVKKETPGAPDHVSTPGFPEFHVNRGDGIVTVLVNDAAEEAKALADVSAKPEEEKHSEEDHGFIDLHNTTKGE